MLISHWGHTDTIQVYSVTVMTYVKALQAGQSSQGTSEPITPGPIYYNHGKLANSAIAVKTHTQFCTRGVERNFHILVIKDGEVVPDVKDRPKSGRPRITTDKNGSFNSPGDFEESSHHCTQPTYALSRTSWQAGVCTDHQEPATCFPVEIQESCPEASPNTRSNN